MRLLPTPTSAGRRRKRQGNRSAGASMAMGDADIGNNLSMQVAAAASGNQQDQSVQTVGSLPDDKASDLDSVSASTSTERDKARPTSFGFETDESNQITSDDEISSITDSSSTSVTETATPDSPTTGSEISFDSSTISPSRFDLGTVVISSDPTSSTSSTSAYRSDQRLVKSKTSSSDAPAKTKSSEASAMNKEKGEHNKEQQEKGGLPATTYIGIGFGCLGALLLIMALSAYWRRWRRKRHAADLPERNSFVAPPPSESCLTPRTPSVMSEKSRPGSPDWSDQPLVPRIPSAYQVQHTRNSSVGRPSGMPGLDDQALLRSSSYSTVSQSNISHPASLRASGLPPSIITSGHTRQFSRPASELVLESSRRPSLDEPSSPPQSKENRPLNLRTQSFAASDKHESLRPPSQRVPPLDPDLRMT